MVRQAATTADIMGRTFHKWSMGCWGSDGADDNTEVDVNCDAPAHDDALAADDGELRVKCKILLCEETARVLEQAFFIIGLEPVQKM